MKSLASTRPNGLAEWAVPVMLVLIPPAYASVTNNPSAADASACTAPPTSPRRASCIMLPPDGVIAPSWGSHSRPRVLADLGHNSRAGAPGHGGGRLGGGGGGG